MTSLVCSLAFFLALFSSTTSVFSLSPYELFDRNGFPVGLLPEGITDYEVDESAGTFSINFKEDCLIQLKNSPAFLAYDGTVQGNIRRGQGNSGLVKVFSGLTIILNTGQKTQVTEFRLVYGVVIFISGRDGPVWSFGLGDLAVSPQCGPDCILISCDQKEPSLALQSD